MSTKVLVLSDSSSSEGTLRCQALAAFIGRQLELDGQTATLVTGPADPATAVETLAAVATAISEGDELRYIPSRGARDRVAANDDGEWPSAILSRHRKLVRHSEGALFTMPMEEHGSGESDADPLRVFITDWSPCPAACAVAVHPAHPVSAGIPAGQSAAFTGRYCRHPLTGDLLPIWVAEWVKPEFGTGAVLVNPGHDKVDLAFGREVGLPIRFALAPHGFTGDSESWIEPPFVKSGVAIRTGDTDGLHYGEARAAYYETLAGRGLAERYSDSGFGAFRVGSLDASGTSQVQWDPLRRTVAGPGSVGERVALSGAPALSAVEETVRTSDIVIVVPTSRVENDLLALRLILAEPGLGPVSAGEPDVVLVGNAQAVQGQATEGALQLALLTNANPLDTVALKPQQLEQCEQFVKIHQDLAVTSAGTGEASTDIIKSASQIKAMLTRRDFKQAFTQLYRLQKRLAKSEVISQSDLTSYLALAHALAGISGPEPAESLAVAWQAM